MRTGDLKLLRKWAQGAPREVLLCRSTQRHSFPPEGFSVEITPMYYVATEICTVCETKRRQKVNRHTGHVEATTYARKDEKEYNVPKGIGRIDRDGFGVFRLARIERFLREMEKKK